VLIHTVVITVVAGACSPGAHGNSAASGSASDAGAPSGATPTTSGGDVKVADSGAPAGAAPTTAGGVSDANILALLHEANQSEIKAAQMALGKSSNPQVKSFAHQMIRDHTKLDQGGDSLSKQIGITPAPPANDSLAMHAQQESATLGAAASGAGFDKQYMDAQVADHTTVLALLQQFETEAQNAQVKAAVSGAMPIVRGHLARARKLAATLGSTTTQS
jgi:putative membrane protein